MSGTLRAVLVLAFFAAVGLVAAEPVAVTVYLHEPERDAPYRATVLEGPERGPLRPLEEIEIAMAREDLTDRVWAEGGGVYEMELVPSTRHEGEWVIRGLPKRIRFEDEPSDPPDHRRFADRLLERLLQERMIAPPPELPRDDEGGALAADNPPAGGEEEGEEASPDPAAEPDGGEGSGEADPTPPRLRLTTCRARILRGGSRLLVAYQGPLEPGAGEVSASRALAEPLTVRVVTVDGRFAVIDLREDLDLPDRLVIRQVGTEDG